MMDKISSLRDKLNSNFLMTGVIAVLVILALGAIALRVSKPLAQYRLRGSESYAGYDNLNQELLSAVSANSQNRCMSPTANKVIKFIKSEVFLQEDQTCTSGTSGDLVSIAKRRHDQFAILIHNDPRAALSSALSESDRSRLPAEVLSLVEKPEAIEGIYTQIHGDNFAKNSAVSYDAISTASGLVRVYFTDKPSLLNGDHIKVEGVQLDSAMAVNTSRVSIISPSAWTPIGIGKKKLAVIMFNFQNDTSEPYTAEETRKLIFTGSNSLNAFYKEDSFGKLSLEGAQRLDGDIFGWYTIPFNNSNCTYDSGSWSAAAMDAAKAAGFNDSTYTNIMFVMPNSVDCSWGGLATLGGFGAPYEYTWVRLEGPEVGPRWDLYVTSHELGHNLGYLHAHSYECSTRPGQVPENFEESCRNVEYGDTYDVMGNGSIASHMNGSDKELMHWLSPSNIETVTTNKTVTLAPIESATRQTQVIRIPRDTDNSYYIEFRQPIGFDVRDFQPASSDIYKGVTIRLVPDHTYYKYPVGAFLLDTSVNEYKLPQAPLIVGKEFVDSYKHIKIKVLSISSKGVLVQVSFQAPTEIESSKCNKSGVCVIDTR